jgi:hypothetical protein
MEGGSVVDDGRQGDWYSPFYLVFDGDRRRESMVNSKEPDRENINQ